MVGGGAEPVCTSTTTPPHIWDPGNIVEEAVEKLLSPEDGGKAVKARGLYCLLDTVFQK